MFSDNKQQPPASTTITQSAFLDNLNHTRQVFQKHAVNLKLPKSIRLSIKEIIAAMHQSEDSKYLP